MVSEYLTISFTCDFRDAFFFPFKLLPLMLLNIKIILLDVLKVISVWFVGIRFWLRIGE